VKWQDGKSKKMEVKRDFNIITLAQRMVRKKCEEGFFLYLERKTYLSWINAKCPQPSIRVDLKARVHHLGFES
jgi:hypothetical protein